MDWFQGKKQEIPHISWENPGFPVKMFPNLSSHWILGFLWTPFLSPHRGHNSLEFLWFGASSQYTHVAVAGVNPKVNLNSPWFSYGSPCFFLGMVIFGNHFWRLFGQNHAIDELYYLPTFGLFVGKMMVICGFSVGFFHQQLTRTHLVQRTSWIKNSLGWSVGFLRSCPSYQMFLGVPCDILRPGSQILAMPRSAKKTELSQTVALLQSYMCSFLLFSVFFKYY